MIDGYDESKLLGTIDERKGIWLSRLQFENNGYDEDFLEGIEDPAREEEEIDEEEENDTND